MMPTLRDFAVHVRRHYTSHQALREFCATLYACRSQLGDAVASDDWLRFIRPIWDFHRLAVAVPLPLNHDVLLSTETIDAIQREASRVRHRIAGSREVVDHICDALLACRRSEVDPLGDVMRDTLTAAAEVAILVPYDNESVLHAIREAVPIPPSSTLLMRSQQREFRDRFRRGLPLVVLGKLANVDPALLRAPLADCSIDVLLYDWTNDRTAAEMAGPPLAERMPGAPEAWSPAFVRVTDVDRPAHATEKVAPQRTAYPELSIVEARPFVLPEGDLLRAMPPRATDSEDRNELVFAVALVVTDESDRRAVTLVEVDDPILVLRSSSAGWSPVEVHSTDVFKGDLYIQKAPPGDHDLIEQMASDALERDGRRVRLEEQQREWKELLSARIDVLGLTAVTRAICEYCDGWRPGSERILEWVRQDTIGPQQKQAFRAVCRFLGIADDQAKGHWRAMRAIQNARIAAGKDLSHRLLERVLEECHTRGLNVTGATTISIGERATTVYPIEFVSPGIRTVTRSSLGFVFPIDDASPDQSAHDPLT